MRNFASRLAKHGCPTIYRCLALTQLLCSWRHQYGKFWIQPRTVLRYTVTLQVCTHPKKVKTEEAVVSWCAIGLRDGTWRQHNAELNTLKAATRLLSCVDISYLETLDRPQHVNCTWIKCIMGCQHHVTMLRHTLQTVHTHTHTHTLRFFVQVMFRIADGDLFIHCVLAIVRYSSCWGIWQMDICYLNVMTILDNRGFLWSQNKSTNCSKWAFE